MPASQWHVRKINERRSEDGVNGRFCLDDGSSCGFTSARAVGKAVDDAANEGDELNFGANGKFKTWSQKVIDGEAITCFARQSQKFVTATPYPAIDLPNGAHPQ